MCERIFQLFLGLLLVVVVRQVLQRNVRIHVTWLIFTDPFVMQRFRHVCVSDTDGVSLDSCTGLTSRRVVGSTFCFHVLNTFNTGLMVSGLLFVIVPIEVKGVGTSYKMKGTVGRY